MSTIHVEAERTIDAPADRVYAFLADYRASHPTILPKDHFLDYHVEDGGIGAGTVIRFRFKAGGRERAYRMRVSEPTPGRVIEEHDTGSSLATSFTITPSGGEGARSDVRIVTEWQGGGGIGGFFERTFAPGALRKIYQQELDLLEQEVAETPAAR
jgi:uncharacterized protein YndB with AHSA1/START domain